MITNETQSRLIEAIDNASDYSSGAKRKQLQSTYDKMLDEISRSIFEEPCSNKMIFRQKVNATAADTDIVKALQGMLRNQEMLFRKDYRDHEEDIVKFLTNDINHFLKALRGE